MRGGGGGALRTLSVGVRRRPVPSSTRTARPAVPTAPHLRGSRQRDGRPYVRALRVGVHRCPGGGPPPPAVPCRALPVPSAAPGARRRGCAERGGSGRAGLSACCAACGAGRAAGSARPCGAERERGPPRREGRAAPAPRSRAGGRWRCGPSRTGPGGRPRRVTAGRAARASPARGRVRRPSRRRAPAVPPPLLPAPWLWQPPPRDFPRRPSAPARRALAALRGSERSAGPGRTPPASPSSGPGRSAEGTVTAIKRHAERPGGAERCQGSRVRSLFLKQHLNATMRLASAAKHRGRSG